MIWRLNCSRSRAVANWVFSWQEQDLSCLEHKLLLLLKHQVMGINGFLISTSRFWFQICSLHCFRTCAGWQNRFFLLAQKRQGNTNWFSCSLFFFLILLLFSLHVRYVCCRCAYNNHLYYLLFKSILVAVVWDIPSSHRKKSCDSMNNFWTE